MSSNLHIKTSEGNKSVTIVRKWLSGGGYNSRSRGRRVSIPMTLAART